MVVVEDLVPLQFEQLPLGVHTLAPRFLQDLCPPAAKSRCCDPQPAGRHVETKT